MLLLIYTTIEVCNYQVVAFTALVESSRVTIYGIWRRTHQIINERQGYITTDRIHDKKKERRELSNNKEKYNHDRERQRQRQRPSGCV